MDKKISIIIPTYNDEGRIRNCLESICLQSYEEFSCIIIDDGSTDSTSIICDEYVKNDNRFSYHYQNNKGVSAARNYGLECAAGDYVMFIDSDDMVDSTYISSFLEHVHVRNEKEWFVSGCSIQYFNKGTLKKEKRISVMEETKDIQSFVQEIDSNIPLVCAQTCWGKLYNLKIIKENGLKFDDSIGLSEDYLFNMNYIQCINQIKMINSKGYNYFKSEKVSAVHRYHPEYMKTVNEIIMMQGEIVGIENDIWNSYVFREYCRTLYHYFSASRYSTKQERFTILDSLLKNSYFCRAKRAKQERALFKLLKSIFKINNVHVIYLFMQITSNIRQY